MYDDSLSLRTVFHNDFIIQESVVINYICNQNDNFTITFRISL